MAHSRTIFMTNMFLKLGNLSLTQEHVSHRTELMHTILKLTNQGISQADLESSEGQVSYFFYEYYLIKVDMK